ncbi:MAG: hypothetical protein Q7S57_03550 [bacterium]|nr:hypothetical protein [bacterium]
MNLYVFAGEDTFRSREAYLKAREEARIKSGLVILRDEQLTEETLSNALAGQTLFGTSPSLAVEGLARFTGDRADNILGILETAPISIEMYIWEGAKPDVRLKIWGYLRKHATAFNLFAPLMPQEIRKIAIDKIQERGGKIVDAGLQLLVQACGTNLWQLQNEIDKLLLYASNREITRADVLAITPVETEINVFSVVRALSIGDGRNAIKNLVQSRNQGEDPRFILSQAVREVRALLAIRDLLDRHQRVNSTQLAVQVGVRDFVVEGLVGPAQKTTTVKLRRLFDQLVVSLYALNSGRAEADDVLDSIALQSISQQ